MNIKLLSFSLCFFYIAASAQVAFEQKIVIDSTYGIINPRAIAVADIDSDGFKDLLIAGHSDAVWAKSMDGTGSFENVRQISTQFIDVSHITVADIDGDGDLDLVSSSHGDNKVAWYENTSTLGHFLNKQQLISTTTDGARDVFAADIDGDDDNDVMFVNQFASEVGYFLNEDGQGTFGEKIISSEIPQNPSVIYSLDMDEDGDMDMITNSSKGLKFIWFPNEGNASFGEAVEITSLIGRINHITSADINGDGKIDLITSSYEDDIYTS